MHKQEKLLPSKSTLSEGAKRGEKEKVEDGHSRMFFSWKA